MRKERRTFDTLHGHPGLLRYAANPVRGCFRQVEGGSVSLPRCTRRNESAQTPATRRIRGIKSQWGRPHGISPGNAEERDWAYQQ